MAEPQERPSTLDEYFARCEVQADRNELVNGRALRMTAGAKNVHDDIVVNILADLRNQPGKSCCRPFSGNGAVETYRGQIRRPDVGVDGGRRDPNGYRAHTPRLVVEGLSPLSRDITSLQKLEEYRSVATLAHILFVEPNAPCVSRWSRGTDGAGSQIIIIDLDARVPLPAIGAASAMRDIYDGVEFPPEMRLVGPT